MDTKAVCIRAFVLLLFFTLLAIVVQSPGSATPLQIDNLNPEAPALAPSLWATPLKLDFGPVGVGETSAVQIVTVRNTGNATLANFSSSGLSLPFHSSNTCASGVQPGNSCTYSFWLEAASSGTFADSMTITTNAGPFTVELQGVGVGPKMSVSPLSLDFGEVVIIENILDEATFEQQVVLVRNTGLSTINGFNGGAVPNPFTMSTNCPSDLAPGNECQYFYNFIPTSTGAFTAISTVSTNAGSFNIHLQGKGENTIMEVSGQRVTPRELDFGPVGTGLTGDPQPVTITNLDTTTFITGFIISDPGNPFTYTQTCDQSLAPGESCSYSFEFSPSQPGKFTGTPVLTNSLGSLPITLHGEGVGPDISITPLSLDFGVVPTGTTSAPQSVTVKNTGLAELTDIYPSNVSPPFSGSQNCNGSLAPGETCQYTFYFSPIESGRYISPTVTTAAGKEIQVTLQGGIEAPVVKKRFIPDMISIGSTSTLEISLRNPNPAATMFDVRITDNFPAGLVIASPLTYTLSPECGTPTFSPSTGEVSFTLSDGTILGGKTCLIHLDVTAPVVGKYSNSTDPVIFRDGLGESASDDLMVVDKFINYLPFVHK